MAREMIGLRGTTNVNLLSILRDVDARMTFLEPELYKLIILLEKIKSKATHRDTFEWPEITYVTELGEVNASGGLSAITEVLTLVSTAHIIIGDILFIPRTGEVMEVYANNVVTGVLGVIRNCNSGLGIGGGGVGFAIANGDEIWVIGNANQQGSAIRQIISTTENYEYNFIQKLRNPIGETDTKKNTALYAGGWDFELKKKGTEHRIEIEKTFLFGRQGRDLTGAQPKLYTGGVQEMLATNVFNIAGGVLTELTWDNIIRQVFRFGPGDAKLVYASDLYLAAVNFWAKNRLFINEGAKKYGLSIFNYVTPHGNCMLADSGILNQSAAMGGWAFILNLAQLKKRHMRNMNTRIERPPRTNNMQQTRAEYISDVGLERRAEKFHGVVYGTTAYI